MPTTARRTILLAVSGMSPAILTETVWALAQESPAVIPDEIVVVTTTCGAADIRSQLLEAREGWGGESPWSALRRALLGEKSGPRLQLAAPRIIELPDPRSGVKRPADDLRTPADNAAAADFLLEEVRRLTENPDTHLIASVAGGRKTMGALLYGAMSLLGRETDRITHVLVSEPYDRCRDFFYPGQPVTDVSPARDGRTVPATKARIDLADIPFVPLRNLFEKELRRLPGNFRGLVDGCRKEMAHRVSPALSLVVFRDRPRIEVNRHALKTAIREHLLMLLLAEKQSDPQWTKLQNLEDDLNALRETLIKERPEADFGDWRHQDELKRPMNEADDGAIRKALSSLRKKLKDLGAEGAAVAAALPSGRRISLDLPPSCISLRP